MMENSKTMEGKMISNVTLLLEEHLIENSLILKTKLSKNAEALVDSLMQNVYLNKK